MATIVVPPDPDMFKDMKKRIDTRIASAGPEVHLPYIFSVNWVADDIWHPVEEPLATQTGITTYRVSFVPDDLIGTQHIDFVTNGSYTYTFADAEGLTWEVEASRENKVQTVSNRTGGGSTIVSVSGS